MKAKRFCKAVAVMLCTLTCIMSSVFVCSAAHRFTISEIDDMMIYLPDDMSAITRSSLNTDRYFSVFGLDYNTTMENFRNGDIYLQGMDNSSSITVTVTMNKTEESKGIGNYTLLSQNELRQVSDNFLLQDEYTSCTADSAEKIVWLNFSTSVNNNGTPIKTYQANTVYDGMSVNITLQRNQGNVTAQDYATFTEIVSSVEFTKESSITGIVPYMIIGVAVAGIIVFVLIIVLVKKAKKRRKKNRNDRIIEELANKYTTKSRNTYDDTEEKESEVLYDFGDKQETEDYSEEQPDDVRSYEPNDYVSENEIDEILVYKRKAYEETATANAQSKAEVIYSNVTQEEPEQIETEDETEEQADMLSELGDEFFGEADAEDEDDYNNDEVLVRQESKQSRFKDSDDFFEEAPKKIMGVISSKDIRDAEDFDVIHEEEKKVTEVEKPVKKKGEGFGNTLKKVGGGIKSFCVHFGYFCTNVSRMIKRKSAQKKRQKAEAERRERARMRAERQNAQRKQMQDGGLVRVHSRNDRRPPQNRRNTSQRRPSSSQSRRPDSTQRRR